MMSIRQSDRALVKTVSSQTGCDYASCDGVAVVAWNDSRGGVWFAVTETNGGGSRSRRHRPARPAPTRGASAAATGC